METPLEIAFHNCSSSPWIEEEIRKYVGKLEKLYDRITACRVSVEALHKQHQTGNIYEVHVDLTLPRSELVVSRTPHKPKERYANPDLKVSLREAFRAAERQLKDFKQRQRGEVKPQSSEVAGQISQLHPEEEHGFILTNTGTQLYFHRNSVLNDGFDRLTTGIHVHYVETVGDTGPIASKVWVAGSAEPEPPEE